MNMVSKWNFILLCLLVSDVSAKRIVTRTSLEVDPVKEDGSLKKEEAAKKDPPTVSTVKDPPAKASVDIHPHQFSPGSLVESKASSSKKASTPGEDELAAIWARISKSSGEELDEAKWTAATSGVKFKGKCFHCNGPAAYAEMGAAGSRNLAAFEAWLTKPNAAGGSNNAAAFFKGELTEWQKELKEKTKAGDRAAVRQNSAAYQKRKADMKAEIDADEDEKRKTADAKRNAARDAAAAEAARITGILTSDADLATKVFAGFPYAQASFGQFKGRLTDIQKVNVGKSLSSMMMISSDTLMLYDKWWQMLSGSPDMAKVAIQKITRPTATAMPDWPTFEEEFLAFLRDQKASMTPPEDPEAVAEAVKAERLVASKDFFSYLDHDGNGSISYAEWRRYRTKAKFEIVKNTSEMAWQKMYQAIDADGDGKVDYAEFENWFMPNAEEFMKDEAFMAALKAMHESSSSDSE